MDPIIRRIAIRRHQITDPTYRLFKMEALTDDTILVEGSATVPFKSGKRKGQSKYIGPTTKAAITDRERFEELLNYEGETGNCARCFGEGNIPCGRDTFRPCPRCGGTTKPPVQKGSTK